MKQTKGGVKQLKVEDNLKKIHIPTSNTISIPIPSTFFPVD